LYPRVSLRFTLGYFHALPPGEACRHENQAAGFSLFV
jgi:hypothetical protein